MTIEILPVKVPGLWPITAEVGSIKVAGTTIAERIRSRFPESDRDIQIKVRGDFLPSPEFAGVLANSTGNCVVRDPAVHLEVIQNFLGHAAEADFTVKDMTFSPIRGPEGNIEYLGHLLAGGGKASWTGEAADLVAASHTALEGAGQ